MNEKLSVLIGLQEIDSKIDAANKCIENINAEITMMQETVRGRKEHAENLKKEITENSISRKEKELEVSAIEERIKKHNMELNAVKTNDAYKALVVEIENDKNLKLKIEDELLEIMEKDEQRLRDIKNTQAELVRTEKEFLEKKTLLENDLKKYAEDIAKFNDGRKAKLDTLPKTVADKYENVRKNKKGIAVVHIEKTICGGCHRNLPIHIVDEVQKDKEIVTCNYCLRILYQKSADVVAK